MSLGEGLLGSPENKRKHLHLRLLSLVARTTGCNAQARLHLFNCDESLSCKLESWAPLRSIASKSEGGACCKDLATPIGIVPETRIRESDVVAIEIDLADLETCQ